MICLWTYKQGEAHERFFPIIDLDGNTYDLGMTHGRILAKEIKANLELYFMMVRGLTGMRSTRILSTNSCLSGSIEAKIRNPAG